MPCLNTTAQSGDLGLGTQLYLDFTGGGQCVQVTDPTDATTIDGTNVFTKIPCLTNVTPPGKSWNTVQDDGCLDENENTEQRNVLVRNDISATIRYEPGGTVDLALKVARDDKNKKLGCVIRHPVGSSHVFEWCDAEVKEYNPQQTSKTQYREAQLALLVKTDTYFVTNANAATLGSGLEQTDGTVT